ncbi:MAG: DUF4174 domain-containing protein [Comamonadaceae bacterium]|nr:MAG: DUF4174 domain-containing protein [Comamonadaceae bacterium]
MIHHRITHAAAACCVALPAFAAFAAANPLLAEQWKTRPVVVVVPLAGDALLMKVQKSLDEPRGREAFRERDMALYMVVSGQGSRNGKALTAAQTQALLQALKLDAQGPPTFVLVGKDGGVKMREGANVDLQDVFAEIDRMPMRQPR